jgi:hypothetical protein
MTRASYPVSARVMPLGARPMAWICAAGFVAAVVTVASSGARAIGGRPMRFHRKIDRSLTNR